jgi:tetratricopeptide (TPR) repeat protein
MSYIIVNPHKYRELALYIEKTYPDVYANLVDKAVVNLATENTCINIYNYNEIAQILFDYEDYEKVEPMFYNLLSTYGDVNNEITILIKKNLGECLLNLHQLGFKRQVSKIEELWKTVVQFYDLEYGIKNKTTVESMIDLSCYYMYVEDFDKAIEYYDQIIQIHYDVKDINYHYFLFTLVDLANDLHSYGRVDEAEKYAQISFNIGKSVYDENINELKRLHSHLRF